MRKVSWMQKAFSDVEYVDNYMGSDVSVNGDTIQVSRSRRKPFLDALNEYLNEVGK